MPVRNEYSLSLIINNKSISRVIIDNHYKEKHQDINDQLILELVRKLDGKVFPIEKRKDGFEYFKAEPIFEKDKPYRLVLLLYKLDDFLGVINAFRVQKEKYE